MNPNHSKDSSEELPSFNDLTFQSNPEQTFTTPHYVTSVIQSQQTSLQSGFIHPDSFFYQPPNDLRNYHINCKEISLDIAIQSLNDFIDNNSVINFKQNEYHFYYQQQSNNRIYRISCEIVCPLSLNKTVYNFEIEQNFGQEKSTFTPEQKENIKLHLAQYLSYYLLN